MRIYCCEKAKLTNKVTMLPWIQNSKTEMIELKAELSKPLVCALSFLFACYLCGSLKIGQCKNVFVDAMWLTVSLLSVYLLFPSLCLMEVAVHISQSIVLFWVHVSLCFLSCVPLYLFYLLA